MTEPIDEQILADIEETLQGIAPPAYRNSFIVEREQQTGNSPRDGLIVLIHGDPIEQEGAPLGHDEFIIPVGIVAYALESEDSGTSLAYRLASMAADIRKALTQDVHRGGVACNTTFPVRDDFQTAQAPATVKVEAHVRYRTLYQNPYAQ